MTSAALTKLAERPAPPSCVVRPRAGEFLAVGGATLLLFPLGWLLRRAVGLDAAELAVGFLTFHAAHVVNDPHFAVTYLLFYKDARNRAFGSAFTPTQRARYIVAGILVPLALCGWAAAALATRSATTMAWMIELMFLLVGWHYVKQGFGVLTVLSARRGVRWGPVERVTVLAHCFAGWAHAWASPAAPAREVEEKGVVYTALAHPPALDRATQIVFFVTTIPLAWVLIAKWRREGRRLPLAPVAGLLVSVWLWTVYSGIDPVMRYMIPALHSIQYLYFVWLLKRNEAKEGEGPPTFGVPTRVRLGLLAVSAIGLGWILFGGAPCDRAAARAPAGPRRHAAPDALGPTPWFAAFYVFVNIHHYFMDHVIWRRDNPETRYLFL